VTFTVGIAALVMALIQGGDWGWRASTTTALFALAAAALATFAVIERRQSEPMCDLDLLRERSFAGSAATAFATSASLLGMFVYLTLWFQRVEGKDGLEAGLRLLPVSVMAFLAAAGAERVSGAVAPVSCSSETVGALSTGTSPLVSAAVQDAYGVALDRVFLTGSAIAGVGAFLAFLPVQSGGQTPSTCRRTDGA
jgi:hypothetical protein